VTVAAARYTGTIHDFVLLNAIRNVLSTEAAFRKILQSTESLRGARSLADMPTVRLG
jgi:hypothetical protein